MKDSTEMKDIDATVVRGACPFLTLKKKIRPEKFQVF